MKKLLFCLVCAAVLLCAACGAMAARYTVTDLGDSSIRVGAMNSFGEITVACGQYRYYPGVWKNGTVSQLSASQGGAADINDHGVVVGTIGLNAVSWNPAGTPTVLGGSYVGASAVAVNESGLVVGSYVLNNPDIFLQHACYWQDGDLVDIGAGYGSQNSAAAVNDHGDILLSTDTAAAYVYSGGAYAPVNVSLPMSPSSSVWWWRDINNDGVVLGTGFLTNGLMAGCLWQGGVTTTLANLAGYDCSTVWSLNNSTVAVGNVSSSTGGASRACIWEGRSVADLNDLIADDSGWTLSSARDINDQGQIIGTGVLGGRSHEFLLTPTPEPSSMVALALGMLGLGAHIRRRRAR